MRDRRRAWIGWAVSTGLYLAAIVAFWPSIRGSSEISDAIENYPDAMKEFFGGAAAFDYTRPGGYLNTQLFSLVLPLLIGSFAMSVGASALADEERSGRLDLILALPVRRDRVVVEKALALTLGVAALVVVSVAVVLLVGWSVDLGVPLADVTAACVGSGLVALVHGLLAFAVGAATGRRAVALGAGWAVFVLGYVVQSLGGLVDSLEPLRVLVPLHHANGSVPIETGFPVGHFALLVVLGVVLVVVAGRLFERRDVMV